MAGNILKWWKHKILGGYKQFSVLQDCTTDSEDIIYPINTSTSYCAPPDLLLVSDRETIQFKKSRSIISTSKIHEKKRNRGKKAKKKGKSPFRNLHLHGNPPRMRKIPIEEFSYDVSVEGGISSECLQFSFTFYDLDGRHGKITKDDIAGIVYTIYESIGKSVVVPYCGSKTINVRLTVSPESKTKNTKKVNKMRSTVAGTKLKPNRGQHRCSTRKFEETDEEIIDERKSMTNIQETTINKTQKLISSNNCNQKFPCFENKAIDSGKQDQTSGRSDLQSFMQQHADTNKGEALKCKSCIQKTFNASVHQHKATPTHAKVLRKTRKSKHQNQCYDSRSRSMSLGNESKWMLTSNNTTVVDVNKGVIPASAEYWNNALKRNDLLDIIRASMERNRLCFQSNGKSQLNDNSPYHRQHSHTFSKIANDDPLLSHTTRVSLNAPHRQDNLTSNSKKNLCGYDSFLHATICATVNSSMNTVPVPSKPSIWSTSKDFVNSTDVLRSGKVSANGYHSQQNSYLSGRQTSSPSNANKFKVDLLNSHQDGNCMRDAYNLENWHHHHERKGNICLKCAAIDGEFRWKNDENHYSPLYSTVNENDNNTRECKSVLNNNININNKDHNPCTQDHNCYDELEQRAPSNGPINRSLHEKTNEANTGKFTTFIPINVDNVEFENQISVEDTVTSPADETSDNSTSNNIGNNSASSNFHHIHEHIHHHYHHFKNGNC